MKNYLTTDFDLNSEQLIEVFDELPLWAAPFGLKLLEKVVLRKGITALDIGFGAGFPLTELAMRLGSTCKVYGIDPWAAAIKRARKKIAFYGINNIQIIKGHAENIRLPSESVDLIVSNNGINNVRDLGEVILECSRVLKKGGQMVLTMNLNNSLTEFYEIMGKLFHELNMDEAIEKMNQQICSKRKPLYKCIDQLENHGFGVKSMDREQFDYKFVDGTTMLNHYFIRMAFLDGWKSIVLPEKLEFIFDEIERRMNDKAAIDGFFRLSVPYVVIDCRK